MYIICTSSATVLRYIRYIRVPGSTSDSVHIVLPITRYQVKVLSGINTGAGYQRYR